MVKVPPHTNGLIVGQRPRLRKLRPTCSFWESKLKKLSELSAGEVVAAAAPPPAVPFCDDDVVLDVGCEKMFLGPP
jgi:hypothetical protein